MSSVIAIVECPRVLDDLGVALMAAPRDLRGHIGEPLIEMLRHGLTARVFIGAATHRRDQLAAFDLRLPLGALEAVAFPLALAARRVAGIKDDRPTAWRAFRTDVPS